MKKSWRLRLVFSLPALVAFAMVCSTGHALATPGSVVLVGAHTFAELDASDGFFDGLYQVSGDLTLTPGSSINCNDTGPSTASACAITISVDGIMQMMAGSAIRAENNAGSGAGGDILIEVLGDHLTLEGSAGTSPGAVLSSRKIVGTDTAGAGDILISVSGCATLASGIEVQAGASISTDGNGEAGSITLASCHRITIDGDVRSRGLTTTGRGGPITLSAQGAFKEGPTGAISSRGGGPGADLVHLEGNSIEVGGLVESTGPGQERPNGKNLCNAPTRLGKPPNSTACVELWSMGSISIDHGGANNGQINADTGFSGGTAGTGWIDILAIGGNITIAGGQAAPHAVHANQTLTNGHGGAIRVDAALRAIATSGRAIQANDVSGGGRGGNITLEAVFSPSGVDLGSASIQAEGATVGGGGQAGGHITVNAFIGSITGEAPGELNARGGAAPGNGAVFLNYCDSFDYTGASTPAATVLQICAEPS